MSTFSLDEFELNKKNTTSAQQEPAVPEVEPILDIDGEWEKALHEYNQIDDIRKIQSFQKYLVELDQHFSKFKEYIIELQNSRKNIKASQKNIQEYRDKIQEYQDKIIQEENNIKKMINIFGIKLPRFWKKKEDVEEKIAEGKVGEFVDKEMILDDFLEDRIELPFLDISPNKKQPEIAQYSSVCSKKCDLSRLFDEKLKNNGLSFGIELFTFSETLRNNIRIEKIKQDKQEMQWCISLSGTPRLEVTVNHNQLEVKWSKEIKPEMIEESNVLLFSLLRLIVSSECKKRAGSNEVYSNDKYLQLLQPGEITIVKADTNPEDIRSDMGILLGQLELSGFNNVSPLERGRLAKFIQRNALLQYKKDNGQWIAPKGISLVKTNDFPIFVWNAFSPEDVFPVWENRPWRVVSYPFKEKPEVSFVLFETPSASR